MSSTPRLDAVEAWIAAGRVGELVVPSDPPGWPAFHSEMHRHRVAAALCCSGAHAELPERRVVDTRTGRVLPAPPTRKPRRRKR